MDQEQNNIQNGIQNLTPQFDILSKSVRYFIFGVTVTLVINTITKDKLTFEDTLSIVILVTLIYAINDLFC